MRGLNLQDYQDRVTESVSDTIKEQIVDKQLQPLLEANGIHLPPHRISEVIEQMVPTNDVNLLSTIYSTLGRCSAEPFTNPGCHQEARKIGTEVCSHYSIANASNPGSVIECNPSSFSGNSL